MAEDVRAFVLSSTGYAEASEAEAVGYVEAEFRKLRSFERRRSLQTSNNSEDHQRGGATGGAETAES
jgi:hypothetical protein